MEDRSRLGIIGKRKLVDQCGKAEDQAEIECDPAAPCGIERNPERPSARVDEISYKILGLWFDRHTSLANRLARPTRCLAVGGTPDRAAFTDCFSAHVRGGTRFASMSTHYASEHRKTNV
jgi:hypothetical protein